MKYTEDEISGLKAQEAKEYCVELLQQLKTLTSGPISPGEAQLQELQYELKLKEAEAEDNRQKEAHERLIKQLELQIEEQRAEQAASNKAADQVRQHHVQVIQRVDENQEKLTVQLERATREHRIRMEMMETEHRQAAERCAVEMESLEEQREQLRSEIQSLGELQVESREIAELRTTLQSLKEDSARELKVLQEEIENRIFDQKSEITRIKREHDLALAKLSADHEKAMYNANLEAADQLLESLNFQRIAPHEISELRKQAGEQQRRSESEIDSIRQAAIEDFRRTFNITTGESDQIDVTELFYSRKALAEENRTLEATVAKLETEIGRMRSHVEKESERVAKAIEAARTNIQNNIEPGVKR